MCEGCSGGVWGNYGFSWVENGFYFYVLEFVNENVRNIVVLLVVVIV